MNDFKKLIVARFLFSFATRTQAVIVGWTMYALTRDPLHLGLVGLAEAVPAIGLALVGGYVVDRSRPVLVYRNVVLGSLLSALVVLLTQSTLLVSLALHQRVLALYCSSLIGGAARAFSQPSMYAIVPKLMPRERLSKASAWMSSAMQVASVLGPAIGGLLYGLVGLTVPAAMACVFLLAALGAIGLIRTPVPAPQLKLGAKVSEELLVGARFVFGHPLLLPALSLDMFSVLFGGVTALLPIFASDILHVGATGLGVLRASPALGAGFVSLVLTRLDVRKAAGSWLFTSVTGFGLCIVAFGLSHSFALSLLVLALSGGFDSISMVVRGTAVQLASPDAMRGRISAVNSIFIGSSNELGEFESGVAAKLLGSVPAVLVGGVVCLATVAVVYATSPVLRKLNLHELEQGS